MGTKNRLIQYLKNAKYDKAEKLAMEQLHHDPRQAQGWVALGEALLKQGHGQAARVVFQRASLLDPQAHWVDQIEGMLAKLPAGKFRPDIRQLLTVKPVSVAAAIMTFNNERSIARCVGSLVDTGAVDEIVVLDSGSTDRTLDILAGYPQVKVIPNVPLRDHFAAKRNQGLLHIQSDWVLWVDADEWLEAEDREAIRTAAGLFDDLPLPAVLSIAIVNHANGQTFTEFGIPRMFPVGRGLRYHGRVHEQVVLEGEGMYASKVHRQNVRIRLHHDGYEAEHVQAGKKLERNLRLLRLMIEEEPDEPAWRLYYGRELLRSGDREQALAMLLEAERKAELQPGFARIADIHRHLIQIYVANKDYDQAEAVCARSLAVVPDFPDTLYWQAHIRLRRAVELMQQTEQGMLQAKQAFRSYRGAVSPDQRILAWKADEGLGDLARLMGKKEHAAAIYKEILAKSPKARSVQKKLDQLLGNKPQD